MDAVGLALSVAQTLFAALESTEIKHLLSLFGYESELEKLQSTVERINAVLLDAEGKIELTGQERDLVRKLKLALYDADDLLDKFKTLAEQEQLLLLRVEKGGKLRRKVRRLISRFGKLGDAYDMAREVRRIGEELEGISSDANKFRIEVDDKPLRKRREETCSYMYQQDIIGREDDVKNVIDLLLATDVDNAQGNISVVSIVGMGGLGKTALAQLVFQRIKEFPLKLWACVADEDGNFDVKAILGKILKSATDEIDIDKLGIERLQRKVRENLDGRKYLLVLDDVWTENHDEWMKLENFLKGSGQRGSRVVVTTRSAETAKAVGNRAPYMLKGLSEKASWRLFKMVALGQEEEHMIPAKFCETGREIVKKCANVPLAIRVVGSLLFGQGIDKWLAIEEMGFASIGRDKNAIKLVLKLSYYHLESPLKSCFTYCALFPKDTVMKKQLLISLWMAQGYLEPLDGDQHMEKVGEEYFSLLLRRCFFQDVQRDNFGEIYCCKMHDLIHDIAQEVAGKEIGMVGSSMGVVDKETRHVYHYLSEEQNDLFSRMNKSRTYFKSGFAELPLSTLLANWKFLRALDLSRLGIEVLPNGIGELLHLRYLNLSGNVHLEMLPLSITKLHNLQTLDLYWCSRLKELPHDLNKLVNLRVLEIEGCGGLKFMPSAIGKLTYLRWLRLFVLGGRNSSLKQQQKVGDIQDLQDLSSLKGKLVIRVTQDYAYVKGGISNGILLNKEFLTCISIKWDEKEGRLQEDNGEALLETLQPHCNLKSLQLHNYPGTRMSEWARENNLIRFFPNIIKIHFKNSPVLELPSLSKLRFLKKLTLWDLEKLEYLENNNASCGCDREATTVESRTRSSAIERESSLFFPLLESLMLQNMANLKGWWRSEPGLEVKDNHLVADDDDNYRKQFRENLPSFPCLDVLHIRLCANLICMPLCPTVRKVTLYDVNEKLRIMRGDEEENEDENVGICSTLSLAHGQRSSEKFPAYQNSENVIVSPRLTKIETDDLGGLKSLPKSAISCLEELTIYDDHRPILSRLFGELFGGYPNSIRFLEINDCPYLKSVSGLLNHLTGLEILVLNDLHNLTFEDEDDGISWISVSNTLQTLKLYDLPQVLKLPKGIRLLTSLRQLTIHNCPKLEERCRSSDGLDWPIIKHVPKITFGDPILLFNSKILGMKL